MVTAPRDKRSDHGLLVALCAREHRRFLIGNPLEDSFVDQPAKTVGENLPRDPEISLELIESTHSQQSVPNDQQRPSLADYLEGARDRTILAVVRAVEHASQNSKSVL